MTNQGYLSHIQIPLHVPEGRLTERNITIEISPNYQRTSANLSLLGELMLVGRLLRKPLTVNFLQVRAALDEFPSSQNNLLPTLQSLYGEEFEFKSQAELIREIQDEL
jgi:hypothetical protein